MVRPEELPIAFGSGLPSQDLLIESARRTRAPRDKALLVIASH